MGNCCALLVDPLERLQKQKRQTNKPNPFAMEYYNKDPVGGPKLIILKEPTDRDTESRYELRNEFVCDEFGVTYLCNDHETGEHLTCKAISNKKLHIAFNREPHI